MDTDKNKDFLNLNGRILPITFNLPVNCTALDKSYSMCRVEGSLLIL